MYKYRVVMPNEFEPEQHFYPKALNSQLHALVSYFLNLNHDRIISRYNHLNPQVTEKGLRELLSYDTKHFYWGGADLFYVTTEVGNRKMVVLETNSCPSGQKSMPSRSDVDEYRGYRQVIENAFLPRMRRRRLPKGGLAVLFDKNVMETSGYAAVLAELTGEKVYLVPIFNGEESAAFFENGILYIRDPEDGVVPIRAAFRYVTQKPWNRIPVNTKTMIFNSTLVCLSGGRNKLLASKAYELFNSQIAESGLAIKTPDTIRDVSRLEIPLWVQKFGGKAVIKNPYSNAGQGVYTITTPEELEAFMAQDHNYDQFIVQSLIGHYAWSSVSQKGRLYHIGTVPNKRGNTYIADLRMMVYSGPQGFYPCAIYARRARRPLTETINESSWDMLGTNLSIKTGPHTWDSDTSRLMLMDSKDFNTLGIGLDDLIEAFIQTVLTVIAIDKMADNLLNTKGLFRPKLFQSLDNDQALVKEIMINS